ncbi:type II secretion system GspH family protein, partial [Patescibacteria group bacterium]|nr:type II secretion system GspH family protein [Patescibacteria group bacterium]
MNRILKEKKGFTLVELAIVLVIIGLILGIGAGMVGPLMKRAKTIETNDIVNAAVDSIVGYALVNKKLPQWTDLNDANIAATEFHYSLRNYKDAWGTPLFYAYDNNLFTTNICTRPTTNITVRKCNDSDCTAFTDTSNVAYIVYS